MARFTYCDKLKELRLSNNYNQSDIALILGIRQEQYSKYESGIRELPLHLLVRLCMVYKTSSDYILGLSPKAHMFERSNIKEGSCKIKHLQKP